MQITKVGHCCMLIEEARSKIITDPGVWSDLSLADLNNIDAVLITHEHSDHYNSKSIKNIIKESINYALAVKPKQTFPSTTEC